MQQRFLLSVLFIFFSLTQTAFATNLAISNVSVTSPDQAAGTAVVQFDISWDRSWRSNDNRDAVWVFVKYTTTASSPYVWSHATLKTAGTNPSGFSQGSGTGLNIVVPSDKMGAILERSADGSGSVSTTSVQFVWDYETDGLTDDDTFRVQVYGVEMVYIPQGDFYIGDGNGTTESTLAFHVTDNTATQITSALRGSVTVDTSSNDDIDTTAIGIDGDGGLDTDNNGSINNASFPTGYLAFYVMKYELSQGQYRDFLNALTQTQQGNRVVDTLSAENAAGHYVMLGEDITSVSNRQAIKAGSNPSDGAPYTFGCDLDANGTLNESTDGEWVAMNYISWMDVCAYADWAALRPMTELEYEKAARGPKTAVYQEHAWGNTTVETDTTSLSNSGVTSEAPDQGNLNYTSALPDGPFRVGSFSDGTSTRQNAGAGHYGVMELSGNVIERCVTVGNSTGRSFSGTHGNGSLSTNGFADNADWPGYSAGEVSGATGAGQRGGSWSEAAARARVSDRNDAAATDTTRASNFGGRLARTAP